MKALLMPVGEDLYAVELAEVREVVPAPAVTPLPRAPATVLGVFNLRGEVIPLLDTAALLGLEGAQRTDHVVVAETDLGLAGLAIEGVPRQAELGEPAGDSELEHGVARYAIEGGVATLIDVEALVTGVRRA